MFKRIGEGLVGAFLGAVVALVVQEFLDGPINWDFVYLGAGVCGALGALAGGASQAWTG